MDAIRKKIGSLRTETETLRAVIEKWTAETDGANERRVVSETEIRDMGRRLVVLEAEFDEANDQLTVTDAQLEKTEKSVAITDDELSGLSRRHFLLEDEVKKSNLALADAVMKLAVASRHADVQAKSVKLLEGRVARNDMHLEEESRCHMEALKIGAENDKRLDEILRKLHSQEDELKRAVARVETAEERICLLDNELSEVGESMKKLELSTEKANTREDHLKQKIVQLVHRLKASEARYEYGEMNITKLTLRIDEIEDDIYREKCKSKRIKDDIDDTLHDVFNVDKSV